MVNISRSGASVTSYCSLDILWKPFASVVKATVHLCSVALGRLGSFQQRQIGLAFSIYTQESTLYSLVNLRFWWFFQSSDFHYPRVYLQPKEAVLLCWCSQILFFKPCGRLLELLRPTLSCPQCPISKFLHRRYLSRLAVSALHWWYLFYDGHCLCLLIDFVKFICLPWRARLSVEIRVLTYF